MSTSENQRLGAYFSTNSDQKVEFDKVDGQLVVVEKGAASNGGRFAFKSTRINYFIELVGDIARVAQQEFSSGNITGLNRSVFLTRMQEQETNLIERIKKTTSPSERFQRILSKFKPAGPKVIASFGDVSPKGLPKDEQAMYKAIRAVHKQFENMRSQLEQLTDPDATRKFEEANAEGASALAQVVRSIRGGQTNEITGPLAARQKYLMETAPECPELRKIKALRAAYDNTLPAPLKEYIAMQMSEIARSYEVDGEDFFAKQIRTGNLQTIRSVFTTEKESGSKEDLILNLEYLVISMMLLEIRVQAAGAGAGAGAGAALSAIAQGKKPSTAGRLPVGGAVGRAMRSFQRDGAIVTLLRDRLDGLTRDGETQTQVFADIRDILEANNKSTPSALRKKKEELIERLPVDQRAAVAKLQPQQLLALAKKVENTDSNQLLINLAMLNILIKIKEGHGAGAGAASAEETAVELALANPSLLQSFGSMLGAKTKTGVLLRSAGAYAFISYAPMLLGASGSIYGFLAENVTTQLVLTALAGIGPNLAGAMKNVWDRGNGGSNGGDGSEFSAELIAALNVTHKEPESPYGALPIASSASGVTPAREVKRGYFPIPAPGAVYGGAGTADDEGEAEGRAVGAARRFALSRAAVEMDEESTLAAQLKEMRAAVAGNPQAAAALAAVLEGLPVATGEPSAAAAARAAAADAPRAGERLLRQRQSVVADPSAAADARAEEARQTAEARRLDAQRQQNALLSVMPDDYDAIAADVL